MRINREIGVCVHFEDGGVDMVVLVRILPSAAPSHPVGKDARFVRFVGGAVSSSILNLVLSCEGGCFIKFLLSFPIFEYLHVFFS